jgi:hypothetical protein
VKGDRSADDAGSEHDNVTARQEGLRRRLPAEG